VRPLPGRGVRRAALAALALAFWSAPEAAAGRQAPPPPEQADVSPEAIQKRIAELEKLEKDNRLDEPGRLRLNLYREAQGFLAGAVDAAERAATLEAELTQARADVEALRQELAQPPQEPVPQPAEGATLADLDKALKQATADLDAARNRLKELRDEPGAREKRLGEIPALLARKQQDLEDVGKQLEAEPPAEELPETFEARQARLLAQRRALRAEIDALDKERRNEEARSESLPLRIERWARRVAEREKLVAAWQKIVDDRRREEALRQEVEAQRAAMRAELRAMPQLAAIAAENEALARLRSEILPGSAAAGEELAGVAAIRDELRRQYRRLQKTAEAVGLTPDVGLLLRRYRAALPGTRTYRRSIERRHVEMARVEFQRLEYEDRADSLVKLEERVGAIATTLPPGTDQERRTEFENEIREQLRTQRRYLEDLNKDLGAYFDRLQELNRTEQEIAELSEQIAGYIDSRVLWVRSVAPLREGEILEMPSALRWLLSSSSWTAVGIWLGRDAVVHWWALCAASVIFIVLLVVESRLSTVLRRVRASGAPIAGDTLVPTFEEFARALLHSARWSLALWALAYWVSVAVPAKDPTVEFARAIGSGLRHAASGLFGLLLLREVFRAGGLAEAHFRWRAQTVRLLRRQVSWATPVVVPAVFVMRTVAAQPQELYAASAGRAALVVVMAVSAVVAQRILKPRGGILHEYLAAHRGGWIDRLRYLWYPGAVLVPVVLGVASIRGYHYTAVHLSLQVAQSMSLLTALVLLYGFLVRWIVVAQRRLAREEARRRRAEVEKQAREAGGEVPPLEESRLDIVTVGAQNRQLLRSLLLVGAVAGLWAIWVDVFPAIGFLREIELWRRDDAPVVTAAAPAPVQLPMQGAGADTATGTAGSAAPGAPGGPEASAPAPGAPRGADAGAPPEAQPSSPPAEVTASGAWVTLADVVVALLILLLTGIVGKNIPGLLEITVLQRLPLEPGGRYAITTLLRYAITIIGVLAALAVIGWTWEKLQWVTAAILVGLGFGLQEVIANFVAGLIILFERPIRLGDTVTVGETSGTVTRIRIRATTIVDWDRKELIVPNKAFITGQVINWTLSDPTLRLRVPVGVAYGSDIALAKKLLLEAAAANPDVLKEPRPQALFIGFGESSLNLELRVILPSIDYLLQARDQLHSAIDQAFRAAGIEISFPQRDIHIRSINAPLSLVEPVAPAPRATAGEPHSSPVRRS
jgi:potassium efflux system protein